MPCQSVKNICGKYIIALGLLLCFFKVQSQYYSGSNINYGKSRVQFYTDKFVWSFYRYERFDVYFYTGGRNLSEYAARYAQTKLPELEKFYDYEFDGRIQFVVYNRNSQYIQSNVGLDTEGSEQNGMGLIQVAGLKVFLYFDGNHANFEKQISEGIARVLFNQFMLGNSFRDRTRWLPVTNLPTWYVEGVISYAANRWNIDMDNRMADAMRDPNFFKLNRLNPTQAALAGHSMWNYIALTYGESMISRILYMTKMSRSANNGLLYMLGLNTKALIADWINYCDKQYPLADDSLRVAIKTPSIVSPKRDKQYYNLTVNPAGNQSAFVVNRLGRYKIYLYDNGNHKLEKIFKGGEQTELPVDNSYPILAWHPITNTLSILIEKQGEIWLVDYDYTQKTTTQRPVYLFDKITAMRYMPNGQSLLVSAVRQGITDVFLYNLASNTYKALTNDLADDLSPMALNDGVIFSSNREGDSLQPKLSQKPLLNPTFDLFRLPLKGTPKTLQRVTQTPNADETQPVNYDSSRIAYLSNESGITNRYVASFDSVIAFIDTTEHYRFTSVILPLTNYMLPIVQQSSSTNGKTISIINIENTKPQLFVGDVQTMDGPAGVTPLPTRFAKYGPDTTARKFDNPISIGKGERIKVFDTDTTKKGDIDIMNYEFDGDNRRKPSQKPVQPIDSLSTPHTTDSFRLPKQRIYLTSFYTEGLVSKFDRGFLNQGYQPFNPNSGYINPFPNALFKVTLKDVMEDYRITGAFRLAANFVGNEYLIRFENLKHRLDRELILHRMGLQDFADQTTRTHIHQAIYGIRYPFKQTLWVKANAIARLDRKAYLTNNPDNLTRNTQFSYWGAATAEAVFDNTIKNGINILYGTKAKLWGEFYNRFNQRKNRTAIIGIDARHYQRISRMFIAAFRVAASTSFGPSKLMYYMGGVDGWLIPRFDKDANIDNTQNYVFQALANGVRGFTQNVRNGNTFVLASAELRFPIIRYLLNYNVKSEVLNNLQLVTFTDAGSAFVGLNPYSNLNTHEVHTIQQGPLNITVKTQRQPFIGGMGWGIRTKLLGYFVRADFANGIQDGKFTKTRFYLSLGTDF